MPSVLIVAAAFPPWGGGGVMRMAKLAKYLPTFGWSVTVLCADVRNPEIYDPDLAAEIPPDVRLIRVKPPLALLTDRAASKAVAAYRSGATPSLVGSLIRLARAALLPDRWILWALRAARLGLGSLPSVDVVLSSGPPHSVHIAGASLARRFRVPHVVDLRDAWAENAFGLRVAPWQGLIDRWLERWILSQARTVVVAAPGYVEVLERRLPVLAGRVHAITNGFDEDDVRSVAARPRRSSSDEIEFLYAGRLVSGQKVGRLFEVLSSVADANGFRIRLHFLGQIDPQPAGQATRYLGSRVHIDNPRAHREAVGAMAQADVLVVTTAGGGMGKATLTGKLFEYLALRRPVLLIGPAGPAADLLTGARAGVWADPDDSPGIRSAIEAVVTMARDPAFRGASLEQLGPFSRARLAGEWADVLEAAAGLPATGSPS